MFYKILFRLIIFISCTYFNNGFPSIPQIPCPFNTNCTCTPPDGPNFLVICNLNKPTFPVFTEYNGTGIYSIFIAMDYVSPQVLTVPSNAFYPLKSLQSAGIGFSSAFPNCWNAPHLNIASGAFNTYKPGVISSLQFISVNVPELTAENFDNLQIDGEIGFSGTCLGAIDDNAFSGLTLNSLQAGDASSPMTSGYKMSSLSLNDMTFQGINTVTSFTYLALTDLQPFKLVNSTNLMLNNNNFQNVPDFAFCACNSLNQCQNQVLQNVNLSNNSIQSNISSNAFANLPFLQTLSLANNRMATLPGQLLTALNSIPSLTTLDLSHNEFGTLYSMAIPTMTTLNLAYNQLLIVPSQLSSNLQSLDISFNKIEALIYNSFTNVHRLQKLNVDNNPITSLEPGAFNGLSLMTELQFQYLNQLTSVDLTVAYGMDNLTTLSFQACSLELISLSDPTKLPAKLSNIKINKVINLKQIDPNVEDWLEQADNKLLDLSLNVMSCNQNMQWMAKYAICQPTQINTIGSKCTNGTSLQAYLQSFQPHC